MHKYDEFRKEMRERGRRMYYRYQWERYAEVVGAVLGWLVIIGIVIACAVML